MAETSKISWTHATFNPWWGCHKVSPACDACYAERDSQRFAPGLWGKDAPRRFFGDKHWNEPLRWNRKAQKEGKPFRVFCASMADVFEDRRDLDEHRERLWALIEATPFLTWLILTKRPENMLKMAPRRWAVAWPSNIWAMTTAEDQKNYDRRVKYLARVPATVRGLSLEPLVGRIDLRLDKSLLGLDAPLGELIHWVITGGESGPTARPVPAEWFQYLRDQSLAAGIPFHFKQWGEWECAGLDDGQPIFHWVGKKAAGRLLDGREWNQYPGGHPENS